jgi:hypothetical protein
MLVSDHLCVKLKMHPHYRAMKRRALKCRKEKEAQAVASSSANV